MTYSEETLMEAIPSFSQGDEGRYDVVIIGAGPAGMSAALCLARAKLRVLLLDKALPGGEASTAYKVTNYLGFPGGITGDELVGRMESQLKDYDTVSYAFGAVIDITSVARDHHRVKTDIEEMYETKYVIVCAGLEPKKLGEPFEQQFLGRGISYYAQCDASSYEGKEVAVVGGGNCACYAADYLSEYVDKLYLIHHTNHLKAVKLLKEKVVQNPKISFLWDTRITEVFGIDKVEKIKLESTTGQQTWLDVKGIFVYVGRIPPTLPFNMAIQLDEEGFIITDEYMRTNVPGIYAAGDIRAKQVRQIATAVSDGMLAAVNIGKEMVD